MIFSQTNTFITDDFLLETAIARQLYYDYAQKMPIIDYHNHLSPAQLSQNIPFENLTQAWLLGDHYKWRAMRANGVSENFITGNASDYEKFEKWAQTVPFTVGNPLFHWTHLELLRYFGIEKLLQPNTASEIYQQASQILQYKTPMQLLCDMNVQVICTTDDPADDLQYHRQIATSNAAIKVFPTFRSDNLFCVEKPNFHSYIEKLSKAVSFEITTLTDLQKAIDLRIDFFDKHNCRLSDFGLGDALFMEKFTEKEVDVIFRKALSQKQISQQEINKYRSFLFIYFGQKYHEKNWVQQYHLGAIRNNNTRLLRQVGADVGCDSVGDFNYATFMSILFGTLDAKNKLSKTITYNLNPSQNEVFATMMGNFNIGQVPSKMQWGAAWWYLDQKDGMTKQLTTLSHLGLLSHFIGMLTDSRSLLSFPRHEYFRRILCNFIGKMISKGELPNDLPFFGKMVENICFYNAKKYFEF
ncbi:MAG: glucuronate isomerase [Capnocytophaga sp.]|nr:glucuronate isomerase [Capnocytophaga sp.]